MQHFKSLCYLVVFGLFVTSCGDNLSDVSTPTRTESETHQKITAEIERFTNAMTTDIQLRSSKEYTAEEFTKNTEESINYTYALPFVKYNETETSKDTLLLTINNCKILESEGPSKYQAILNKIICAYTCSNLNNKKLKFVKVSIIDKSCSHIKLSIVTSVGTTDVPATAGVPNPPGPSNHASYRKEFNSSYWATIGGCGVSSNVMVSTLLTDYATHNIIGGDDWVHTLINAEIEYINSINTPQTNWWKLQCYDPNYGGDCAPDDVNCDQYFVKNGEIINYNQVTALGYDVFCLDMNELNSILLSTEAYCTNFAQSKNKDFVSVHAEWNFPLCFDLFYFWDGSLTIGEKIYRLNPPQNLPTISCNCI